MECGGGDCDDDDGDRFHDNFEACDPSHDEDCDPTTFGDLDADGDGFVSSACCNGDACGEDCDDSRREVFPGATEACNAVDDDCNGFVDDPGAFCPVGTCTDRRCRALSWEQVWGGPSHDAAMHVTADSAGNIYLALAASGVDIDSDGEDEAGEYLLSLTPEGRIRWIRPIYSAERTLAVAPDAGALVLSGLGGDLQWISTSDGSDGTIVDPSPGSRGVSEYAWSRDHLYVVTGHIDPPRPGEFEYHEYLVLSRFTRTGVLAGMRTIDQAGTRVGATAFAVNGNGEVILAGTSSGPLDLGGGTMTPGTFLAKLGPAFERIWEASLSSSRIAVHDVAISEGGGAAAVGSFEGVVDAFGERWDSGAPDFDAFAVSLAADGSHRWTHLHDGPGDDLFIATTFDERGGIMVSGQFTGDLDVSPHGRWAASGSCDAVLASWDAIDGFTLAARRLTGTGCERINDAWTDSYGATVLVGQYSARVTLLRGEYPSVGGFDAFIVRVSDL